MDQRYLPRWIVVLIDLFLINVAWIATYFILAETPIVFYKTLTVTEQGFLVVMLTAMLFFVFKTYSGIIRHSSFTDIVKLALALFFTMTIAVLFNIVFEAIEGTKILLTTSIFLYCLLSFTLLFSFRVAVKESYYFLRKNASLSSKKRTAILGTNDDAISLANALLQDSKLSYTLVGFISENQTSRRFKILGKPIVSLGENYTETLSKLSVESVLMIHDASVNSNRQKISEALVNAGIEVLSVPSLIDWTQTKQLERKIKPIQIEDLLDRDPISINTDLIKKDLEGKTILVTGGAGSIGSEIVRQVAGFTPKTLVILDQSELSLYQLELALQQEFPKLHFVTELADISNMYRLELLFEKYDFDIVYHAAAYKHVPLIERNPHEAIYVNILGTVNLSILSTKHEVKKFVMVSTDKAVNPTNVMGASKRAAEMYVQALQQEKGVYTRFITTRFGNVLGSSGSVIPLFRKQIAEGGPVTVTHKDIIRYFMTIPEACQLVLQAGTMGNGGEIYVFDMGKPVKIYELAKRMIRLSGFEPDVDIKINISGLRPGEKLYEELLNDSSTTQPTHHPKIMISKVPVTHFETTKEKIKAIITSATTDTDLKFVKLLKELVPEFKSENSQFEKLDMRIRHKNVDK
ncbi:polysaccharide biosynthesis protein [Jejudonia soesokkakensis]|uniref:Polysaccharide biosynthesis protein n=1 Tax=Jejudonia soesokkakensis TaxID=1323432 RepID=A0ABW2MUP3_9FLAO